MESEKHTPCMRRHDCATSKNATVSATSRIARHVPCVPFFCNQYNPFLYVYVCMCMYMYMYVACAAIGSLTEIHTWAGIRRGKQAH